MNNSVLIAVSEVAELLDVSERTVWRLKSSGRLPLPVRIGSAVRWRIEEIQKWISDGCPVMPSISAAQLQ